MSGIEEVGRYSYATVVKQAEYDPRNDIESGQVFIVAGRHPDGYSYTVVDEQNEGFRDIHCETLGVVGPADSRLDKMGIQRWASEQEAPTALAESASNERSGSDGDEVPSIGGGRH